MTTTTRAELERLLCAAADNRVVTVGNFIDGAFRHPTAYLDSVEPATGAVWLKVPRSGEQQVREAVEAAKRAFPAWAKTSVQERARLLNRVADILEPLAEDLARLESLDQGKTVATARAVDIPRCLHNFRTFASAIQHHTGTSVVQREPVHALNFVQHDPIGVAALIAPWNLPLYLLSFKLAPALACGNTVVAKPSEMTSATALVLAQAFAEAGFPAGVVNIVVGTGPECGEPLVTHPDVALVSFTGSTLVGKRIGELAARGNKKVSLEMGGKNAAIVFQHVDVEATAEAVARSCFANQGEICLCTERLFLHSAIHDVFLEKLVAAAKKWSVGDPTENNLVGALASKPHFEKVVSYFDLAQREGCTVHCGGPVTVSGRCAKGYFFAPTVVSGVKESSKLLSDEIFGPFVSVMKFDTIQEVIDKANATPYGLSASVWSNDIHETTAVASALRVGTVWCNCWMVRELNMPFGGTKESGNGRDGTVDSFDFYSEKKTVCIKI